jgi:hypothetical protein
MQLRWVPSDAVLCTPLPVLSRSCSTAQQSSSASAPPSAPAQPSWLPQSAQAVVQRFQSVTRTVSANTPEQVEQLATAAKTGKLFRVVAIQSNNLWLRFGGGIVAIAFAGGTYTLYRTSQSVYSAITGIKDDSWTFRIIVRYHFSRECVPCAAAVLQNSDMPCSWHARRHLQCREHKRPAHE